VNTADLSKRVQDTVESEPSLPVVHIESSVENGIVTLSGNVPRPQLSRAVVDEVSRLDGVRGVVNQIRVAPGGLEDEVKEQILQALTRDAKRDADAIRVTVEGGKVILRGVVRTWAGIESAESAAWIPEGVKEVESHLRSDEELAGA
jgi:osmotically-inducible protein OsmY